MNKVFLPGFLLLLATTLTVNGCAPIQPTLRPQSDIYPAKINADTPLVLAIPGLNVPGAIPQQDHFGNLVEMLALEGIPSRVLAYDTPEHPLTPVASLGYNQTNIATTRVTPDVVDAIQFENTRRAEFGLPPVKEVVFFSYSQGAVIANRIANGIHLFRLKYIEFQHKFGIEWTAVQSDPEFLYLMNALADFIMIRDIKVQKEYDFNRDPDLVKFYDRTFKKLDAQATEFFNYLRNPSQKYPTVTAFEPPESAKYPKIYPKLQQIALQSFKDIHDYSELKQFFVDYATYRDVLDVKFRFVSTAGSYFGSPVASRIYNLMEAIPLLQLFIGTELRQIKDTRLGAEHQTKDAEDLLIMKRENHYPYREPDTMFILGANGDRGDGMVDQSAAHLAVHALGSTKLATAPADGKERVEIVVDRLPDFTIVPLPTKHFPESNLFGHTYGAAYMEKGSPVFPYVLNFVRKDWATINASLAESNIKLQQFMVEITFQKPKDVPNPLFQRKSNTGNVRITGEFTNKESDTYVWMGTFVGDDQRMNLDKKEDDSGFVTLTVWRDPQHKRTMDIPVYPGCNTLVKMELS